MRTSADSNDSNVSRLSHKISPHKNTIDSSCQSYEIESDQANRVGLTIVPRSTERQSFYSSTSQSSDLELDDMRPAHQIDHEEMGLTAAAKDIDEQRSHERYSEAHDRRASVDSRDLWEEARRLGKRAFMRKITVNATLIGFWFVFSYNRIGDARTLTDSKYNKWMFSAGNLDFHFPLFVTSGHMIIQFTLACAVLFFFPNLRPRQAAADKLAKDIASKKVLDSPIYDPSKPIMTPWFYITRIASCGAVTGLDIGLGNTSLKYISLTFFTMCKSSTLGFVLAFAIIFRLEKPSWKIGGIMLIMTVGVVMMVAGETAFNSLGFVLLMMASLCSGLRWSLTQILLRRTPATSNPFCSLFFLTPVMFFILFIIAIPAEGFPALLAGLKLLVENKGLLFAVCIILFPGFLAFCMVSAEFALLQRTSVVTLSVCGVFKEVLTITVAGIIFGDTLTPINISGLVVTLIAIAVYNVFRMQRMKKEEVKKAVENMEENTSGRTQELSPNFRSDEADEGLLADGSDTNERTHSDVQVRDWPPGTEPLRRRSLTD